MTKLQGRLNELRNQVLQLQNALQLTQGDATLLHMVRSMVHETADDDRLVMALRVMFPKPPEKSRW